jgi:hypothetical protein
VTYCSQEHGAQQKARARSIRHFAFEMVKDSNRARTKRVAEAVLRMTKLDIEGLKRAYEGALRVPPSTTLGRPYQSQSHTIWLRRHDPGTLTTPVTALERIVLQKYFEGSIAQH